MTTETNSTASNRDWMKVVAKHQKPSRAKACWQLVNSVGFYALLWGVMYFTVEISWLLTIAIAIVAGGLIVRNFIIFHDCGHGSFFKSRRANDFWGFITGVISMTPYGRWRHEHAIHHAGSGHLDRRGVGDIWTLTVEEYLQASRFKRIAYRIVRNPFSLFILGPIFIFILRERFPMRNAKPGENASVWKTNAALLLQSLVLIWLFGFMPWLIIQFTAIFVAGFSGIWLFYVQHQFEDTYWADEEEWDFAAAAMEGSSFYKLPKVLQWFSGNIGFHHIHHLSPRIPNYNLESCHRSHPMFQEVRPLTILGSLKTLSYRLWDEKGKRLISFGQLKKMQKSPAMAS